MPALTYADMTDDVLGGLTPPRRAYYVVLALLAALVAWAVVCWTYQVRMGMGVAGINHPIGWGVYIVNFVFWVGIAHSGTLISAILHLVRSRWRAAISRAAEAMTVFAVMTAGLFPLIHLGRLWVFYYIIPYPSVRQLWPNFTSPLVWDVVAISTYLTVSTIFWYVGLIPDLASARDRCADRLGDGHLRTRAYRRLSLGWTGSSNQWRHYGRSYLFFAALATPLVISVHSVVSWDFAMSLLPGWHTTIFPPYFVAGAIHSGLAMVLTLLIPLRRLLRMERVITPAHFDAIAKTLIVTTIIVGYAYVIEPFIAWYSGDRFEQQFALWRATGWLAWGYWMLTLCNVLIPLAFLWRRARRSIGALFFVSIAVNVGMWLERLVIIVGSTSHDFLPHNWDWYLPTWVEISISVGALSFFLLWFFAFSKLLPTVAASEVKELLSEKRGKQRREEDRGVKSEVERGAKRELSWLFRFTRSASRATPLSSSGLLAVFRQPDELAEGVRAVRQAGFEDVETFSPFRLDRLKGLGHDRPSPVRYWTLAGGLTGAAGGFALAIVSAMVNNLVVGAKLTPRAIIPYCIIAFEGTVLLGTIFNLTGMLIHARLRGKKALHPAYDRRFSRDRFGLFVPAGAEGVEKARAALAPAGAEEVRVIQ